MVSWLKDEECQIVAMESTGSYWKPLYNIFELESVETRCNDSVQAYETIKAELLADPKMKRTIALKGKDKERLLLDIIPRFNLTKEQVAALIDKDGADNGIAVSAKEIAENPYLLCEKYIGNNQDDVISFYQIDNGALPSPEYGVEKLTDADSAERFRALCVDALRWDNTHTFTPCERILDLANHRVSKMRDWRQNTFQDIYFEVDRETLAKAITFRTEEKSGKLYLYLNDVYDEERLVESTLTTLTHKLRRYVKTTLELHCRPRKSKKPVDAVIIRHSRAFGV
jgi:hypothetical protein